MDPHVHSHFLVRTIAPLVQNRCNQFAVWLSVMCRQTVLSVRSVLIRAKSLVRFGRANTAERELREFGRSADGVAERHRFRRRRIG